MAPEQLARLTGIAHFIDELLNITPSPGPALRRPQRIRPQGRHARGRGGAPTPAPSSTWIRRRSATRGRWSSRSSPGRGRSFSRAERSGIPLDDEQAAKALRTLKEREHRGYHYEAADASFELLLRKETDEYEPLFRLEGFRVLVEKREDGKVVTEATIKVWVDGER